jgi:hypothetical protein
VFFLKINNNNNNNKEKKKEEEEEERELCSQVDNVQKITYK